MLKSFIAIKPLIIYGLYKYIVCFYINDNILIQSFKHSIIISNKNL